MAHDPGSGYTLADFDRPEVRWELLEAGDDGHDVLSDGVVRCWLTPGHSAGGHDPAAGPGFRKAPDFDR
jgi:hypothetical protein